jgi:hypothetical protein
MLLSNIISLAEMLFGDSGWANNLKGYTESPMIYYNMDLDFINIFVVVVVISDRCEYR